MDERTVLVVEDDDDCRYVYGEFLRFAGYSAIEEANARDALARLEANAHVGLVILDLVLPGMEPREFIARMRALGPHASTPILILSGRHDIESQAAALKVDGYLRKPCDLVPLSETVETLFRRTRLPPPSKEE